jgi:hypothetical protein
MSSTSSPNSGQRARPVPVHPRGVQPAGLRLLDVLLADLGQHRGNLLPPARLGLGHPKVGETGRWSLPATIGIASLGSPRFRHLLQQLTGRRLRLDPDRGRGLKADALEVPADSALSAKGRSGGQKRLPASDAESAGNRNTDAGVAWMPEQDREPRTLGRTAH